MSITAQQAVFRERVGRIRSGKGVVSTGTVFVGDEYSFRRIPNPASGSRQPARLRQLVVLSVCLLAGALSQMVVVYGDWLFSGRVALGITEDAALARQAGLALALAVIVTFALHLGDRSTVLAKVLGVALGMTAAHNLVHLWPAAFSSVFAPDWTAHVLASTEAQSLLIRGSVISF
ncbi:MAG: hypothetical protein IAE87_15450 [Rhodobacteraceae bacterium]|nr:hypothetical protein [Paracoccaceae bacterium]